VDGLGKGVRLLRLAPVLALVAADLWSKAAVFEWLQVTPERFHRSRPLFGTEWLAFSSSCNGGAAFGQFSQFQWFLVIGRIVAVAYLGWLLVRHEPRPRGTLLAITLVLAGALGNVLDNLWLGCALPDHPFLGVRDFLDVDFEPLFGIRWHFPAFNLADSCITVGAVAWILTSLLHRPEAPPAADPG